MVNKYDVLPRYTPGSPGWVDEMTALRVAEQEKHIYPAYLEGVFGEENRLRAQVEGLEGIVFRKGKKGFVDAITDRDYGSLPYDAIRYPNVLVELHDKPRYRVVTYFYHRQELLTFTLSKGGNSGVELAIPVFKALQTQHDIDMFDEKAKELWKNRRQVR